MSQSLTLLVKKGRSNVFYQPARLPQGNKVVTFYTNKSGDWKSVSDIVYVVEDRFVFNINDSEIDAIGDANYRVTLTINGEEREVLTGTIDYDDTFVPAVEAPVVAPTAGVLLLEPLASVPASTPANTVIFEKPNGLQVWDFTKGSLPAGWSKVGAITGESFDSTGMTATINSHQGYVYDIGVIPDVCVFEMELLAHSAIASNVMIAAGLINAPANAGVGACWYNGSNGLLTVGIGNALNYNGTAAGPYTRTPSVPARIRIRRNATQWFAGVSFDNGATWTETAPYTVNTGVNRLLIGSVLDNSGPSTVKVKQARYMLGASTGIPKGWWDGSKIQPL